METSVELCPIAAYKLHDVDLAWRIPMMHDSMVIMGLSHIPDAYDDRLM
jgi:hypothetical protein